MEDYEGQFFFWLTIIALFVLSVPDSKPLKANDIPMRFNVARSICPDLQKKEQNTDRVFCYAAVGLLEVITIYDYPLD